jgi:hypothetical protein
LRKKKVRGRIRQCVLRGGQHAPEKIEKPEHLDQHTYNWPFEENEEYPTKEAGCPS